MTWTSILAIAAGLAVAFVVFLPRVRRSSTWQATVTPLASIIGSGFLIVAPLLGATVGSLAVLAVSGIVALAWAVGSVVRYNIENVEALLEGSRPQRTVEQALWFLGRAGKISLVFAYVIGVTFYLELLGAFALKPFAFDDDTTQKILATVLLVVIGGYGWWRGLRGLEFLEEYAVDIKLVVISALLAALVSYNVQHVAAGDWHLPRLDQAWTLTTLQQLAGAFLIVQGFETSRYLRGAYTAAARIRTMRYAQWLSAGIYVSFVGLATILLGGFEQVSETEVIDLSARLSALLPPMLVVGGVMAQFSAAVADTIASGGLVAEVSADRIGHRPVYVGVMVVAIILLWSADIFAVVSYASRAFALYYGIQCVIAALHVFSAGSGRTRLGAIPAAVLALVMGLIAAFALPVDSG